MFLFILESIGTSELVLIAIVALIVPGPRKLPQMAKTIGKTMSEFRNATNEFKTTWEKEVAFEDEGKTEMKALAVPENSIAQNSIQNSSDNQFLAPQVRELSPEEYPESFQLKDAAKAKDSAEENKSEKPTMDKRDWL